MASDIRVFANGYDGCAFLNCGLVRGIQIPHPFSVSAGAIAFLIAPAVFIKSFYPNAEGDGLVDEKRFFGYN